MKPVITGIHHVALMCRGQEEFEKTIGFYRDVLGLKVARSWDEHGFPAMMLDTGAGLLEIFSNATDAPGQGALRHIALATPDMDAVIQAVKAAGYTVTKEPKEDVAPSTPPYPIRFSFCIGPLGEKIEFFTEL